MTRGETKSRFKFEIEDSVLDDWELLELFASLDEDPTLIFKCAKTLLGSQQYGLLKEHCRVDGRVSKDRMNDELSEIMNQITAIKK